MTNLEGRARVRAWVVLLLCLGLAGCKRRVDPGEGSAGPSPASAGAAQVGAQLATLELEIFYGSEKKTWFEAELARFNASSPRLASGQAVKATGKAMGSGEAMAAILTGRGELPHVFSPASSAYLTLLNYEWLSQGGHKPIALPGEPLVLSPLVIAMWRPMAEVLGWPQRPLGWADILKVSRDDKGWAAFDRPEWGAFKLGHTNPEYSTSGLLTVLAIAAAAKPGGEARRSVDPADPAVKDFLAEVQDAVVHYGKSTGFFADKMLERGPSYLSAAVLYENLVIESYARVPAPSPSLVAIYPVEGTFWSDHPFAVLDAPWVSAEHREAAALLQRALRAKDAQQRAVALGFRAADPSVPITAPIDEQHGVDPKQPQNLLDVPDGASLQAMVALWRSAKKAANVVLVFDKSGSMAGAALAEAKQGAKTFLGGLDPRDNVTLLFFDHRVYPPVGPLQAGAGKAQLEQRIDGVIADGGTALYDAIAAALTRSRTGKGAQRRVIRAVVAMTDGRDESSELKSEELLRLMGGAKERDDDRVSVFTVGYGKAADPAVLTAIADAGKGAFARGDVASIIQVFRDLAAYF
jgi:Ca-activated chloride channel homolog